VIVAKPEVGYDANAVHLLFAQLIAEHHRWNFDVARYAWAAMPLGADWSFAAAYLLSGESATRLLNFGFGAVALELAFRTMRRFADREIALAITALLASMPLAFLVTGSLFSEGLWIAFL